MFVILTYDVGKKRVQKVMKICRKYLSHEQKSVFEGMITQAKLNRLKQELQRILDTEQDTINIYELASLKYAVKEKIGINHYDDNII